MKLKALVDAVRKELEETGCEGEWVHLSAAFTAKEKTDGTVECRFVDESAIPAPRDAEIHRVEIPIKVSCTESVSSDESETSAEKRVPESMPRHEAKSTPYAIERSKQVALSKSRQIGDPLLGDDPLDTPIQFRDEEVACDDEN